VSAHDSNSFIDLGAIGIPRSSVGWPANFLA
jgi:hypothetical protein